MYDKSLAISLQQFAKLAHKLGAILESSLLFLASAADLNFKNKTVALAAFEQRQA